MYVSIHLSIVYLPIHQPLPLVPPLWRLLTNTESCTIPLSISRMRTSVFWPGGAQSCCWHSMWDGNWGEDSERCFYMLLLTQASDSSTLAILGGR